MYLHNFHTGEDGKSGEDLDFEEVQALMARAAADMEQDAQKALQDMQKDKELMERLTVIKQRQEKKDGQAGMLEGSYKQD